MFLRVAVAVVTKTQESHKHHESCMLNERKKKKGSLRRQKVREGKGRGEQKTQR
jgi:hypothetical protein